MAGVGSVTVSLRRSIIVEPPSNASGKVWDISMYEELA